jgi:hypothetical protein
VKDWKPPGAADMHDEIIDLCADIDEWDDNFANSNPTSLVLDAQALLGRARSMLKELADRVADRPTRS